MKRKRDLQITSHEPDNAPDAFQEIFDDDFLDFPMPPTTQNYPMIDVIDRDDSVLVRANVPGLSEEDVEIIVTDGYVTIAGETSLEKENINDTLYQFESYHGAFARGVHLPSVVVPESASASLENGVLSVIIKKEVPEPKKKVSVRPKTSKKPSADKKKTSKIKGGAKKKATSEKPVKKKATRNTKKK